MKHLVIAVATVLAGGLALHPAHAAIFGPVGAQTQQADSGFELGGMETKQSYTEYPPPGVTAPNPLDTQNGTIPGIAFGYRRQDAHLNWGIIGHLSDGSTTYNGYTQNQSTGAFTPDTVKTANTIMGFHGWLGYGFSPSALPNFSFTPNVLVGYSLWARDNSMNAGGSLDGYHTPYLALRLQAQYALGPVVVQANADIGHTFGSSMNVGSGGLLPTNTNSSNTYNLGNSPWRRYGVRVVYNAWKDASVYASVSRTTWQYGESSNQINGFIEPGSSTVDTAYEVGVEIH